MFHRGSQIGQETRSVVMRNRDFNVQPLTKLQFQLTKFGGDSCGNLLPVRVSQDEILHPRSRNAL